MWETIKNDPILKTVAIIILSVLGFGFAFNIMFGQNSGGMEGGHGSSGSSLGNTLSYIFILAFKLILIALVVIAIVAVFKLARKHLFNGGEIKVFDSIKKDPVLKGLAVFLAVVVALGLIYYLFAGIFGLGSRSVAMGGAYGYGMMQYGSTGFGLAGILAVLIKLLLVVSVIGLVIGLAMYIKQNYSKQIAEKIISVKEGSKPVVKCKACGIPVTVEFKFCPQCGEKTTEECKSCGLELKSEWKCCPACGTDRASAVNDNVSDSKQESLSTVTTEEVQSDTEGVSTETIEDIHGDNKPQSGDTTKHPKGKRH